MRPSNPAMASLLRLWMLIILQSILMSSSSSQLFALAWTDQLLQSGQSYFSKRTTALKTPPPPSNVKLLILPGFGNDKEDYFLKQAPEGSLVQSLQNRGWYYGSEEEAKEEKKRKTVEDPSNLSSSLETTTTTTTKTQQSQIRVLPVARLDWIKVFAQGIFDRNFWSGQASVNGPAFGWYLNLIVREIQSLCPDENDRVVLVGHSAGGWLARAALGHCSSRKRSTTTENGEREKAGDNNNNINNNHDDDKSRFPLERVLGLVTLGTPQSPPPPPVEDVTRGALRLTNELFPNNFHAGDNLFYITVMGESVEGVEQDRKGPSGFAYESYTRVCGIGNTIGDGVVPVCSGHLDGAIQINLPGVLHSINAPESWYGSNSVLDSWHSTMIDCILNSPNLPSRQQGSWVSQLFRGQ
ncbi:hypothetical protein ACA910_000918 [Epithemia clementina (nom. ined.)]